MKKKAEELLIGAHTSAQGGAYNALLEGVGNRGDHCAAVYAQSKAMGSQAAFAGRDRSLQRNA